MAQGAITQDSSTKAQQVANEQALANEKAFNEQMAQIDKEAADAKIAMIEDPAKRAQAEGDLKIQEEKAQMDKELADLQESLNKKEIAQETYEKQVADVKAKYANLEAVQAQTTAKQVLQANPAAALLISWQNTTVEMQQFWSSTFSSMASTLTQFLLTGKANISQFVEQVVSELVKMQLQKYISESAHDI